MKEMSRTCLVQAHKRKVRLRSLIFCLPLLLCFIAGVTSVTLPLDGASHARAAERGQNGVAESEHYLWREIQTSEIGESGANPVAISKSYRLLSLNDNAQREMLRHAPMEFSKAARQTNVVMSLPMPDGKLEGFRIEESPVMAPRLAARFPNIKTYRGKGLDDPTATTRFDVTPAGLHAIVLSARGTVIIEPAARKPAGQYISYDQRDAPKEPGSLNCLVSDAEQTLLRSQNTQLNSGSATVAAPTGTTLRTYRLALAATAEYTQQYGGGTISGALSAMTTTINAVNAIYERDLAIHLTLIENETSIIFTDTTTDGYTSDNATAMYSQNQAILDSVIGSANYDLGMVFDGHVYMHLPGRFLFEGQGQFQSACVNGQKGKGVTVFRSTYPSTTSAIFVVAHEMGHKLGGSHAFNGTTTSDCLNSRIAAFAYEPGTGSTIMAYRGGFDPDGNYQALCGAEDLHSTDTYFHAASIQAIVNYTTFGNGSFCPAMSDTGNNPPTVDAGANYTIAARTPFTLTATGNDTDGDSLTYCWEEFDLGAPAPPNTDNGNRPIFRSFAPTPSPARSFPQLSDILSGASTFGESLPTTTRTMNFRVTVRDNHSGGGGVNSAAMQVSVSAGSGPFAVTQPGSLTTWAVGSSQIINWDVANTSSLPVNCGSVRVLLSIDGGSSFPFILSSSTANNGAATITVPNTPTPTARVKVEAVYNIFFNISPANFTITPSGTAAPMLLTEGNTNRATVLDSVTFVREPFPLASSNNFSLDQRTRITLFAIGLELLTGEDLSVVTAQAEDVGHNTYPMRVEYVGKVPGFGWLTQVVIRMPDGSLTPGDYLVSVNLRGALSNKVIVGIR